jgi:outer membrane lipoprotein LolB
MNAARIQPLRRVACALVLLVLSACALPPQTSGPQTQRWQGRLAMTVQSTPIESVQAGFELSGDEQAGALLLLTPIGTTAASARWSPEQAFVQRGNDQYHYPDTQSMMVALTGAPLPLGALFDWLQGRDTVVAGWAVERSGTPLRRLVARRASPEPALTLRVVLNPSP